ncbi:MAG: 2-isopropylmalate synthase [Deltaproteobacteria bacterium]|nr:2-isopropylmalate synthase [Deltaproteobacteria bacterium]
MEKIVRIFDTTLRDGEQSPGCSMNLAEKIRVARQLAALKVDIIEAGFPIASPGDFESVREVARTVKGPVICGLARATEKDIDRAWEAVREAERARIHIFIATSDLHLQFKLKKSREEVLEQAVRAVRRAKKYTEDVEFSAEDAARSDVDYLCRVIGAVIDAGATTVNIPDTVGYAIPDEFGRLIAVIREKVENIDRAVISVHCHNDLGLAVANSLAAVQNGARQVECTINGLGERAGNASLEETVMAVRTRKNLFGVTTNIETEKIYQSSRLVSNITGMLVQANKAVVGANAFAHESGIHQDGFLKKQETYEIMTPESIGLAKSTLVLGKHSGRHAFRTRLEEMGYRLNDEEIDRAFDRFKILADAKKEIFDEDIVALIADEVYRIPDIYELESVEAHSVTGKAPRAKVRMCVDGECVTVESTGDGPVDAVYSAIRKIAKNDSPLVGYFVKGITGGTDAQGEVTTRVRDGEKIFIGQGADTDIILASARAYVNALNRLEHWRRNRK